VGQLRGCAAWLVAPISGPASWRKRSAQVNRADGPGPDRSTGAHDRCGQLAVERAVGRPGKNLQTALFRRVDTSLRSFSERCRCRTADGSSVSGGAGSNGRLFLSGQCPAVAKLPAVGTRHQGEIIDAGPERNGRCSQAGTALNDTWRARRVHGTWRTRDESVGGHPLAQIAACSD